MCIAGLLPRRRQRQTAARLRLNRGECYAGALSGLDLFDLAKFEIHRGRPAENRNGDLDARALLVDLFDNPVEGSKRTVGDADIFADLEADRRLGVLDALFDLALYAVGLGVGNRRWLIVRTQKSRDLR